jgi:hypothetical protein
METIFRLKNVKLDSNKLLIPTQLIGKAAPACYWYATLNMI